MDENQQSLESIEEDSMAITLELSKLSRDVRDIKRTLQEIFSRITVNGQITASSETESKTKKRLENCVVGFSRSQYSDSSLEIRSESASLNIEKRRSELVSLSRSQKLDKLKVAILNKEAFMAAACLPSEFDLNSWVDEERAKTWLQFILESGSDHLACLILAQPDNQEVDFSWIQADSRKNYLHIAAEKDLPWTLEELLAKAKQKGVLEELCRMEDLVGFTPFHYSAERISDKALEKFLKYNIDITLENRNSRNNILTIVGHKAETNPKCYVKKYQDYFSVLETFKIFPREFVNKKHDTTDNSPLHHAVLNGTLGMVKSLVRCGALPEPGRYENTPLYLAASEGNYPVLEFLIQQFASGTRMNVDVNFPNCDGDTALHAAARACKKKPAAVESVCLLLKAESDIAIKNKSGETPLDLIFSYVQNPTNYLERKLFDDQIQVEFLGENNSVQTGQIINFNYKILNPQSGGKHGEVKTDNMVFFNLFQNILKHPDERKMLVKHPLIESFIDFKWRRISRIVHTQLLLTVLLVLSFSVFCSSKCSIYLTKEEKDWSIGVLLVINPILFVEAITFELFLYVTRVLHGLQPNSLSSSLGILALLGCSLTLAFADACDDIERDVAAWSVLIIWFYCFSVISIEPCIGSDTLIFFKIGQRLLKLICAYFSILAGFGIAFSIILKGSHNFGHPLVCINTLVTMMIGELNLEANFPPLNITASPYSTEFWRDITQPLFTAHVLYLLFVFTASVVVSNIFIAFAVQDVEAVLRDVELNKLITISNYICLFETSFLARFIDFSIETCVKVMPGLQNHDRQDLNIGILEEAIRIWNSKDHEKRAHIPIKSKTASVHWNALKDINRAAKRLKSRTRSQEERDSTTLV